MYWPWITKWISGIHCRVHPVVWLTDPIFYCIPFYIRWVRSILPDIKDINDTVLDADVDEARHVSVGVK
jgi:hypothetical protein